MEQPQATANDGSKSTAKHVRATTDQLEHYTSPLIHVLQALAVACITMTVILSLLLIAFVSFLIRQRRRSHDLEKNDDALISCSTPSRQDITEKKAQQFDTASFSDSSPSNSRTSMYIHK